MAAAQYTNLSLLVVFEVCISAVRLDSLLWKNDKTEQFEVLDVFYYISLTSSALAVYIGHAVMYAL